MNAPRSLFLPTQGLQQQGQSSGRQAADEAARQEGGACANDNLAPREGTLRVACVTPWYINCDDALTPPQLGAVEYVRAAVGRAGRVEALAFGPSARWQELGPGILLRILPATELGLSWELPEALAGCDLVHLLDPFSRAGETCLLLAKLHGKPVCVSHTGMARETVGTAVDMLALADAAVPPDSPPERLAEIYQALLTRAGEAAECVSSS
jgi:hypothetical protein